MAKRATKKKQVTTNISMPASLRAEVESQMLEGGFENVSEYVRHLVRAERVRSDEARARLRFQLDQGDRSGPGVPASEAFWSRVRATARSSHAHGRRRAG